MAAWKRTIPFQVDVAGVIQIMGSALYSCPEAAVRELIQNAHDAVLRRRRRDLTYQGRIDLIQQQDRNMLEIHDDGFGLDAQEAETYLGTLGLGLTGLLRGEHPSSTRGPDEDDGLIGMFGIGLFSAFMLCDWIEVESRKLDREPVRWRAGAGTHIELCSSDRTAPGTTVRLELKPEFHWLAQDADRLEKVVREYADFLLVPIYLNRSTRRVNSIRASWFEPTPDRESVELELAAFFDEAPLDVIPIRVSSPSIVGALYVTPRRTPGFAGEAVVTATVRRMVISRRIQDLIPPWASFVRGVLELSDCRPTASREDLVRDDVFRAVRDQLESRLYEHFETCASSDPTTFQAVLSWHRYSWAGAALSEPRLRALLRRTYLFSTTAGRMTFDQILDRSVADPLIEPEFDRVIWYHTERRQEGWIASLFVQHTSPCVHALRPFEESLLAAMVADVAPETPTDLRFAGPTTDGFAESVLGISDLQEAPDPWTDFLADTDAVVFCGAFQDDRPVIAFHHERHELQRSLESLKKNGTIPPAFQRLIDSHFADQTAPSSKIVLNSNHRLVRRALQQGIRSPLASVLRLLVAQALTTAGATPSPSARRQQLDDLDWIAECLWGKG